VLHDTRLDDGEHDVPIPPVRRGCPDGLHIPPRWSWDRTPRRVTAPAIVERQAWRVGSPRTICYAQVGLAMTRTARGAGDHLASAAAGPSAQAGSRGQRCGRVRASRRHRHPPGRRALELSGRPLFQLAKLRAYPRAPARRASRRRRPSRLARTRPETPRRCAHGASTAQLRHLVQVVGHK
jgi:hypothetical protein